MGREDKEHPQLPSLAEANRGVSYIIAVYNKQQSWMECLVCPNQEPITHQAMNIHRRTKMHLLAVMALNFPEHSALYDVTQDNHLLRDIMKLKPSDYLSSSLASSRNRLHICNQIYLQRTSNKKHISYFRTLAMKITKARLKEANRAVKLSGGSYNFTSPNKAAAVAISYDTSAVRTSWKMLFGDAKIPTPSDLYVYGDHKPHGAETPSGSQAREITDPSRSPRSRRVDSSLRCTSLHSDLPRSLLHSSLPHAPSHSCLPHTPSHSNLSFTPSYSSLPLTLSHSSLPLTVSHSDLPHTPSHSSLLHTSSHSGLPPMCNEHSSSLNSQPSVYTCSQKRSSQSPSLHLNSPSVYTCSQKRSSQSPSLHLHSPSVYSSHERTSSCSGFNHKPLCENVNRGNISSAANTSIKLLHSNPVIRTSSKESPADASVSVSVDQKENLTCDRIEPHSLTGAGSVREVTRIENKSSSKIYKNTYCERSCLLKITGKTIDKGPTEVEKQRQSSTGFTQVHNQPCSTGPIVGAVARAAEAAIVSCCKQDAGYATHCSINQPTLPKESPSGENDAAITVNQKDTVPVIKAKISGKDTLVRSVNNVCLNRSTSEVQRNVKTESPYEENYIKTFTPIQGMSVSASVEPCCFAPISLPLRRLPIAVVVCSRETAARLTALQRTVQVQFIFTEHLQISSGDGFIALLRSERKKYRGRCVFWLVLLGAPYLTTLSTVLCTCTSALACDHELTVVSVRCCEWSSLLRKVTVLKSQLVEFAHSLSQDGEEDEGSKSSVLVLHDRPFFVAYEEWQSELLHRLKTKLPSLLIAERHECETLRELVEKFSMFVSNELMPAINAETVVKVEKDLLSSLQKLHVVTRFDKEYNKLDKAWRRYVEDSLLCIRASALTGLSIKQEPGLDTPLPNLDSTKEDELVSSSVLSSQRSVSNCVDSTSVKSESRDGSDVATSEGSLSSVLLPGVSGAVVKRQENIINNSNERCEVKPGSAWSNSTSEELTAIQACDLKAELESSSDETILFDCADSGSLSLSSLDESRDDVGHARVEAAKNSEDEDEVCVKFELSLSDEEELLGDHVSDRQDTHNKKTGEKRADSDDAFEYEFLVSSDEDVGESPNLIAPVKDQISKSNLTQDSHWSRSTPVIKMPDCKYNKPQMERDQLLHFQASPVSLPSTTDTVNNAESECVQNVKREKKNLAERLDAPNKSPQTVYVAGFPVSFSEDLVSKLFMCCGKIQSFNVIHRDFRSSVVECMFNNLEGSHRCFHVMNDLQLVRSGNTFTVSTKTDIFPNRVYKITVCMDHSCPPLDDGLKEEQIKREEAREQIIRILERHTRVPIDHLATTETPGKSDSHISVFVVPPLKTSSNCTLQSSDLSTTVQGVQQASTTTLDIKSIPLLRSGPGVRYRVGDFSPFVPVQLIRDVLVACDGVIVQEAADGAEMEVRVSTAAGRQLLQETQERCILGGFMSTVLLGGECSVSEGEELRKSQVIHLQSVLEKHSPEVEKRLRRVIFGEYDPLLFKTRPCFTSSVPCSPANCPHYHGPTDHRRNILHHPYCSTPCKLPKDPRTGLCKFRESCSFAQNAYEAEHHPHQHRGLCRDRCVGRHLCQYMHEDSALYQLSRKATALYCSGYCTTFFFLSAAVRLSSSAVRLFSSSAPLHTFKKTTKNERQPQCASHAWGEPRCGRVKTLVVMEDEVLQSCLIHSVTVLASAYRVAVSELRPATTDSGVALHRLNKQPKGTEHVVIGPSFLMTHWLHRHPDSVSGLSFLIVEVRHERRAIVSLLEQLQYARGLTNLKIVVIGRSSEPGYYASITELFPVPAMVKLYLHEKLKIFTKFVLSTAYGTQSGQQPCTSTSVIQDAEGTEKQSSTSAEAASSPSNVSQQLDLACTSSRKRRLTGNQQRKLSGEEKRICQRQLHADDNVSRMKYDPLGVVQVVPVSLPIIAQQLAPEPAVTPSTGSNSALATKPTCITKSMHSGESQISTAWSMLLGMPPSAKAAAAPSSTTTSVRAAATPMEICSAAASVSPQSATSEIFNSIYKCHSNQLSYTALTTSVVMPTPSVLAGGSATKGVANVLKGSCRLIPSVAANVSTEVVALTNVLRITSSVSQKKAITATNRIADTPTNPVSPSMKPVSPPTNPVYPPTNPPTNAVSPPTNPVSPPTNPVTPPTNPGSLPTNPVSPPTNPVSPPTNPVSPPTNPVSPPTNPVSPPTNRVSPPTNPVFSATNPVSLPTNPVSLPTNPVSPPTNPVFPPTNPVSPPTNPVSPPTNPVSPPTKPVSPPTKPVSPPTKPVSPPTKPVSPPTKPVSPPTKPVSPPTKPVSPPTKPVSPPTKPVSPPTKPVSPPTKPVSPPTKPVSPPTKPVSPPTKPVSPPTKPVSPPTKPVSPSTKLVSPSTKLVSPSAKLVSPPTKLVSPPTKLVSPPTKLVSPQTKLVSPQTKLVSPQTKPVSPQTKPVSPQTKPVSPQTKPVSPQTKPVSPQTKPVSPQTNPFSPQTSPFSPQTNPVSPQTNPVSPQTNPVSPQTNPVSPQTNPVSPLTNPVSPLTNPVSPLTNPVSPLTNPVSPLTNPVSPLTNPVSPLTNPVSPLTNPVSPLTNPVSPLTNPVSPLTNPVSPLTNPVSPLTNPVSPLTNPVSPLTNPVSPLTNPVSPLTNPVSPLTNPVSPLTNPVSPLTNPVFPLTNPVSPLTNPVSPQTNPVSPLTNPVSPLTNPVSPLTNPVSPLTNPVSPLTDPVSPLTDPVSPLTDQVYPQTKPVYPQTKPVYPQTKPVYPQTKPVYPQTKPVYPQTKPVYPQTKPVYPQTKPVYPQTKPVSPLTNPVSPTIKLAAAPTRLAATPTKSAATSRLAATPTKPAATPTKPAATPTIPAATPTKPGATPTESASTPKKPASTPKKPASTPKKLAATSTKVVTVPATVVTSPAKVVVFLTEAFASPSEAAASKTEIGAAASPTKADAAASPEAAASQTVADVAASIKKTVITANTSYVLPLKSFSSQTKARTPPANVDTSTKACILFSKAVAAPAKEFESPSSKVTTTKVVTASKEVLAAPSKPISTVSKAVASTTTVAIAANAPSSPSKIVSTFSKALATSPKVIAATAKVIAASSNVLATSPKVLAVTSKALATSPKVIAATSPKVIATTLEAGVTHTKNVPTATNKVSALAKEAAIALKPTTLLTDVVSTLTNGKATVSRAAPVAKTSKIVLTAVGLTTTAKESDVSHKKDVTSAVASSGAIVSTTNSALTAASSSLSLISCAGRSTVLSTTISSSENAVVTVSSTATAKPARGGTAFTGAATADTATPAPGDTVVTGAGRISNTVPTGAAKTSDTVVTDAPATSAATPVSVNVEKSVEVNYSSILDNNPSVHFEASDNKHCLSASENLNIKSKKLDDNLLSVAPEIKSNGDELKSNVTDSVGNFTAVNKKGGVSALVDTCDKTSRYLDNCNESNKNSKNRVFAGTSEEVNPVYDVENYSIPVILDGIVKSLDNVSNSELYEGINCSVATVYTKDAVCNNDKSVTGENIESSYAQPTLSGVYTSHSNQSQEFMINGDASLQEVLFDDVEDGTSLNKRKIAVILRNKVNDSKPLILQKNDVRENCLIQINCKRYGEEELPQRQDAFAETQKKCAVPDSLFLDIPLPVSSGNVSDISTTPFMNGGVTRTKTTQNAILTDEVKPRVSVQGSSSGLFTSAHGDNPGEQSQAEIIDPYKMLKDSTSEYCGNSNLNFLNAGRGKSETVPLPRKFISTNDCVKEHSNYVTLSSGGMKRRCSSAIASDDHFYRANQISSTSKNVSGTKFKDDNRVEKHSSKVNVTKTGKDRAYHSSRFKSGIMFPRENRKRVHSSCESNGDRTFNGNKNDRNINKYRRLSSPSVKHRSSSSCSDCTDKLSRNSALKKNISSKREEESAPTKRSPDKKSSLRGDAASHSKADLILKVDSPVQRDRNSTQRRGIRDSRSTERFYTEAVKKYNTVKNEALLQEQFHEVRYYACRRIEEDLNREYEMYLKRPSLFPNYSTELLRYNRHVTEEGKNVPCSRYWQVRLRRLRQEQIGKQQRQWIEKFNTAHQKYLLAFKLRSGNKGEQVRESNLEGFSWQMETAATGEICKKECIKDNCELPKLSAVSDSVITGSNNNDANGLELKQSVVLQDASQKGKSSEHLTSFMNESNYYDQSVTKSEEKLYEKGNRNKKLLIDNKWEVKQSCSMSIQQSYGQTELGGGNRNREACLGKEFHNKRKLSGLDESSQKAKILKVDSANELLNSGLDVNKNPCRKVQCSNATDELLKQNDDCYSSSSYYQSSEIPLQNIGKLRSGSLTELRFGEDQWLSVQNKLDKKCSIPLETVNRERASETVKNLENSDILPALNTVSKSASGENVQRDTLLQDHKDLYLNESPSSSAALNVTTQSVALVKAESAIQVTDQNYLPLLQLIRNIEADMKSEKLRQDMLPNFVDAALNFGRQAFTLEAAQSGLRYASLIIPELAPVLNDLHSLLQDDMSRVQFGKQPEHRFVLECARDRLSWLGRDDMPECSKAAAAIGQLLVATKLPSELGGVTRLSGRQIKKVSEDAALDIEQIASITFGLDTAELYAAVVEAIDKHIKTLGGIASPVSVKRAHSAAIFLKVSSMHAKLVLDNS